MPSPGAIVVWWQDQALAFGVMEAEEKGRLRLISAAGRVERVPHARVVFVVGRAKAPAPRPDERRVAGEAVVAVEAEVRELATRVDVAVLWELTLDTPESVDLKALADLSLDGRTDREQAAVTLALAEEGVRFVRRGQTWEPRAPATVDEIERQKKREADKKAERDLARQALVAAGRGEPFEPTGSREETRFLRALEELAILERDAPENARATAARILSDAGISYERPHEGAFRLLRRLGHFHSDDENLQVRRYRLKTEFPEAVLAEADERAAQGFDRGGRADLTGLDVVTIDGPHTREVDDGLSLERGADGSARLGVHIADPAAFVDPGSLVDREALARTVTYYLADRRLPMLPEVISEDAASLVPEEERPALSFLIDLDDEGGVESFELVRSVIRSRERIDYTGADGQIGDGQGAWRELLGALSDVATRRERFRAARGAILMHAPEIDVRVDSEGTIVLERIEPRSPSRRVVSESMVLAGEIAARFCIRANVPVIYRRQAPPVREVEVPADGVEDPVDVRAVRRSLRRGETTLVPEPHFALGLDAYVQATSPLRRFQDLAAHRQISAVLGGSRPVYDPEEIQRVMATTEAAEGEGRRAESAGVRYWLLRYLQQRRGETVQAVVVEVAPRPVVQLTETLVEQPVRSLTAVKPGDLVTLIIEHVNPRADTLILRPGTQRNGDR